ncbi:hypothetical protein HDK77DRAFT_475507 [Phyllosticta capitalensis]
MILHLQYCSYTIYCTPFTTPFSMSTAAQGVVNYTTTTRITKYLQSIATTLQYSIPPALGPSTWDRGLSYIAVHHAPNAASLRLLHLSHSAALASFSPSRPCSTNSPSHSSFPPVEPHPRAWSSSASTPQGSPVAAPSTLPNHDHVLLQPRVSALCALDYQQQQQPQHDALSPTPTFGLINVKPSDAKRRVLASADGGVAVDHATNPPNVGFPSTPRKPPSVATGRSLCSARRALIGTLCASPARPSHAVRQAQLFQDQDASPVQDEILGRPGGVPVDSFDYPDDSPTKLPSDDSWSDDRLYKDAPRTVRSNSSHLNKWLQNQYPSPNVEADLKTNMSELALSPGSRRLPNSFLGDRHNLDAPVNRNVREYDGAVANFTLSKIKTALQAHPEHVAALPAGMDAQLSHQLPVSHPSRPSLPPRETYVSGGLFPMSTLQTPDDQGMNLDSVHLPHRFKRASLAAGRHKPESPLQVDDDGTSPTKREPKRSRRLSSNPQLTAAALSAIAAIQGHHGSASSRTREDVLQSCALYSNGSDCDSSSLPSPSHFRSTLIHNNNSPATPLMPPATPHLLPVSSSPLLHPSSPHFIRSALRGAGPQPPMSPHLNGLSPLSTRPSSPSHSPLAPPPRRYVPPTRFSPTRHGLSPDVVLFRGDSVARAKLRERRLGRKREGSWGDESLFGGRGRGVPGTLDGEGGAQGVTVDSGEEADEEDEGEGEGEEEGGVPVAGVGCGQGAREGVDWVFGGEVARV